MTVPAYTDWRFSLHARETAERRGIALVDALLAACDPEVAYPQPRRGPGMYVHQRGNVAVGVNRDRHIILTVLHRVVEQWSDA